MKSQLSRADSEELLLIGLRALSYLASNCIGDSFFHWQISADVRDTMAHEGVVALIGNLLKTNSASLVTASLVFLNNFFYHSSNQSLAPSVLTIVAINKKTFMKEGEFPSLLQALSTFVSEEKIASLGSAVLRNLCSNSEPYAPTGSK